MTDNQTTALIKSPVSSPALARVSGQLAVTERLLQIGENLSSIKKLDDRQEKSELQNERNKERSELTPDQKRDLVLAVAAIIQGAKNRLKTNPSPTTRSLTEIKEMIKRAEEMRVQQPDNPEVRLRANQLIEQARHIFETLKPIFEKKRE